MTILNDKKLGYFLRWAFTIAKFGLTSFKQVEKYYGEFSGI